MNFESLKTPELQEKLKAAKTPEEILAIAKEEGYELSEDDLQAVSGGIEWNCSDDVCSSYSTCPGDVANG